MYKEDLNALKELSKEQLIYLIEQLYDRQFLMGEVCVEESKSHIASDEAVNRIRGYIYDMPSMHNISSLRAFIDWKMGKITLEEYRDIMLSY